MNAAKQLQNLVGEVVDFRGVKLRLRLAPLSIWVKNGRLPTRYRREYLSGIYTTPEEENLPADEAIKEAEEFIKFREDVVRYALLEPRVCKDEESPKPDEVKLETIQNIPDLFDFIFAWATYGGRASVPLREGSIEADHLGNFPAEPREPDNTRGHGENIPSTPLAGLGNPE